MKTCWIITVSVFTPLNAATLLNFLIQVRRLFKVHFISCKQYYGKSMERALMYTHFELIGKVINESKFPKLV